MITPQIVDLVAGAGHDVLGFQPRQGRHRSPIPCGIAPKCKARYPRTGFYQRQIPCEDTAVDSGPLRAASQTARLDRTPQPGRPRRHERGCCHQFVYLRSA